MTIWLVLGSGALLCALAAAARFPIAATGLWILTIEITPDLWLPGAHETLIGVEKGAGVVLVVLLGIRFGWRRDRYNPGFAFIAMFFTGLLHGLFPGLTIVSSLRSLVGSAAPFAFGFTRLDREWERFGSRFNSAVVRVITLGPLANIVTGIILNLLQIHEIYTVEGGVFRLAGAGLPAFLGGFALIAIYAGLMEIIRRPAPGVSLLLALNFGILLLTGARTPLALATLLILGVILWQRRLGALAAVGAAAAFALLFLGQFNFIRIVNLAQLGQAGNLSNRNLIWPFFKSAIKGSPWLGWGVGAGKVVVPTSQNIAQLLGTNAAHNEYLRIGSEGGLFGTGLLAVCLALWAYRGSMHLPAAERWLIRLVFIAFAVHSATDNTLIATTSSVLFIWTSTVFAQVTRPREA